MRNVTPQGDVFYAHKPPPSSRQDKPAAPSCRKAGTRPQGQKHQTPQAKT